MIDQSIRPAWAEIQKFEIQQNQIEKGVTENARMALNTKMPYRPNVLSII